MKSNLLPLLVLMAILPTSVSTQEVAKSKAPAIPREMYPQERSLLDQSTLLLSKGQFDPALALLKSLAIPSAVPVYVDYAMVPKADRARYRQAVKQALEAWNQGLSASAKFQIAQKEEDAFLFLLFEDNVASVKQGQVELVDTQVSLDSAPTPGNERAAQRTARIRIALNVPYLDEKYSMPALIHLVGKALGTYLGLSPTQDAADLMGPDTQSDHAPVKPSVHDLERVREIAQVRRQLADYAQRRITVSLPRAILTIAKSEINVGDVQRGDKAHFTFILKNTGDAPLEIFAKPNCGCTVANYDKLIPPGGAGKVEAEMQTVSFRGKIHKTIDITSNDLDKPTQNLHLLANVLSVVQILPAESAVIALKQNEPTVQEFELRTTGKEPVEINRVTCGVPYATATLKPMDGPGNGPRNYKLTLTVQPEAPIGRSVFTVTAYTTAPREPQVNITAICDKGILVLPQSLFMGAINPTTALPVNQMVTLMKHEGAFHILKFGSDDPSLQIKSQVIREGGHYQLHVSYTGGWSAGSLRSKITVETDDPQQPKIEIPVMAHVSSNKGTTK